MHSNIENKIPNFAERVSANQRNLTSNLKTQYDFIVCGSGSAGSVVARRLAENPDVSVLLVEAGGDDNIPEVMEAARWPVNLGSERDWSFQSQPAENLNGRSVHMAMGKVLGGGSSINIMTWARGHKSDWDFFAAESGEPAWNYESVLKTYRSIEDWGGVPDPQYRGTGGPVFVAPTPNPNPIGPAMVEGASSIGIPTFENQNGRMMESAGGASIMDVRAHRGIRQSVFRSYVFPCMDRPNLTVLTHALVTRLLFEGKRVSAVEISHDGKTGTIRAGLEVVLSLGAINTPKVLMQSGIGDQRELHRWGIPLVEHLPGVGKNFQDHPRFSCVWESSKALPPYNNLGQATFFWKSDPTLSSPDLQSCQAEVPLASPQNIAEFGLPTHGWTLANGVVRPKSRGHIALTGRTPYSPVKIHANFLSDPDDLKAAVACVEIAREIGNSKPLQRLSKREVMPGNLQGAALENFLRDGVESYFHETCTAKMGRDSMSVVDGNLKVYGIENLRIADGSIFPRIPTGNTMAPCVMVGERAAEFLRASHKLLPSMRIPVRYWDPQRCDL